MAARVPTFVGAVGAFRAVGDVGANSNLLTIFNKAGSGVLVAVRRLTIQNDQTAAGTTVIRLVRTTRLTTAPTDGTLLTPQTWDTLQTHNANVEIRGRATADDTNGTLTATAVADRARQAINMRAHTLVGQLLYPDTNLLLDYPYPDDPLVLREGEGVLVSTVGAGVITTAYLINAMIEEFTYAVRVPYRNPMPQFLAQ